MCCGSWDHPKATQWFSRTINGTQYIVLSTAQVYCSKRIQSKISKGKGTWREVQSKSGASSQESSSSEISWRYLIPPVMSDTWEGLYIGETHYRLAPRIFNGTCLHWHHLLSIPIFQTFRRKADILPKSYCLYNLGIVRCPYLSGKILHQGLGELLYLFKCLDASWAQPCKHLSKNSSVMLTQKLTWFLHSYK